MGHSHKMRESRCGPRSIQRLKRPTTCNMFPVALCVCGTHCQRAAVRLIGRNEIVDALHPSNIALFEVRGRGQWALHLAAITQAGGWKSTRMPLPYAEKINAARSGMARAAAASGRDESVSEEERCGRFLHEFYREATRDSSRRKPLSQGRFTAHMPGRRFGGAG